MPTSREWMMAVIVGVYGEDKVGKSSFALTLPTPIAFFEFDIGGFGRAAWRFKEQVEEGLIVSKKFVPPQQVSRDKLLGGIKLRRSNKVVGMKEIWYEQFLPWYFDILEDKELAPCGKPFRTLVFDSAPEVWDLCTRTYLQELQELDPSKNRVQLLQIEYAESNSRMKALFTGPKEAGKNLVLTHYMTDKYGRVLDKDGSMKDDVIGRMHAGWKMTTKVADIMVECTVKKEKEGLVPYGEVVLCGLALELTGMVFREPSWAQVVSALNMYRGES